MDDILLRNSLSLEFTGSEGKERISCENLEDSKSTNRNSKIDSSTKISVSSKRREQQDNIVVSVKKKKTKKRKPNPDAPEFFQNKKFHQNSYPNRCPTDSGIQSDQNSTFYQQQQPYQNLPYQQFDTCLLDQNNLAYQYQQPLQYNQQAWGHPQSHNSWSLNPQDNFQITSSNMSIQSPPSFFPSVYQNRIENSQNSQSTHSSRFQSTPRKNSHGRKNYVQKPLREIPLADMSRNQLKSKVKNLENAFAKAQSKCQFADEEIETLEEKIEKLKKDVEKEKDEKLKIEKENEALKNQLNEIEANTKMDETNVENMDTLKELQLTLENYKTGTSLLAKQLSGAEEINQQLNLEVKNLKIELENLKKSSEEKDQKRKLSNIDLQNKYNEIKKKYDQEVEQVDKLAKRDRQLLDRHSKDFSSVQVMDDERKWEALRFARYETHHDYLVKYLKSIDKRLEAQKIPRIFYEKSKNPEILNLKKQVFQVRPKTWKVQDVDLTALIMERHPTRMVRPKGARGAEIPDPYYRRKMSPGEFEKFIEDQIKIKKEPDEDLFGYD